MAYGITKAELSALNDLKIETRQDAMRQIGGIEGLAKKLKSDPNTGIMPVSHDSRKQAFGENVFPPLPVKSFLELCMEALEDTTMQILCVAAAMSLTIGVIKGWPNPVNELYEGIAVLSAVVIVTLVTAINELQKEKQFQSLNAQKDETFSNVIRGGTEAHIRTSEVLVGDVVKLTGGDKIPGDGVMFSGFNARSDEAPLTGESETVRKSADGNFVLFSGCLLSEGTCMMYVTSIGPSSQWGIIKVSLSERDEEETPLQEKLNEVAELIGHVGLGVAIACFVVLTISWIAAGNYQYQEFVVESSWRALLDFLVIAVTIVAVAVPEGLPLAVTISLAYSMKKMYSENNLVRHLQSCETMGSATMICSDKTGTLTQNIMTVVEGCIAGQEFNENGPDNPINADALQLFHLSAQFNSTATAKKLPDHSTKFIGNATECAMLKFSQQLRAGDAVFDAAGANRADFMPFNSASKSASCIVKADNGDFIYFATGASETIVGKCSQTLSKKGMTAEKILSKEWEKRIELMAKGGLRTVGLCFRKLTQKEGQAGLEKLTVEKMTMLGVLGVKDPVRKEVPAAVRACKTAGITVRMVTGDNLETARFIARECHILEGPSYPEEALTGPEFAQMSDDQIKELVDPKLGGKLRVLARSSPMDKLRLVKILKELDEVVAVTGDGTNDAPALKEANVGLAMNIAGTEVAKEASDIIILDDNFKSIVSAVKWGRSVFDNIRKFIQFQLTINFVALILAFFSAVWCAIAPPRETEFTKASFDTEKCTPLNAIQLLWINLIMDSMGALALATEEPEDALLLRKPVGKREGLISPIMWRNIAVQGIYQLIVLFGILFKPDALFDATGYVMNKGESYIQSRPHYTVIFNAFVWCQIFNEFNSRRLDNEPSAFRGVMKSQIFLFIIVCTVVTQYLFVEYGGEYTKTVPLTSRDWLVTVLIGAVTIPIGFFTRLIAAGASSPAKSKGD